MAYRGMGIPDTFLHARFDRALPDEYGHVKATLQAIKNRDPAEIIRNVGTQHSTLPQKEGAAAVVRLLEQAFFSNESGDRSRARRGRGRGYGGTQGRGHGESSSKDGGSKNEGGSSSASSASGSSHGGGSSPPGRCRRCNKRGYIREECTTKESDFIAKYARCLGFGHEESTCSSDTVVLAVVLEMLKEDLAVEAQAFVAKEICKCSGLSGNTSGVEI